MLTTQLSLLARLHNSDDVEAWRCFVELYQPVIYRSLCYKGLQAVDAEDVTQQVLLSIAKTLAKRPHDPDRARFRTWLQRVIRNAALNALQRVRPDRAAGGTDMLQALHVIPETECDDALLDREHRKQLFRVAADGIQHEFEPETWDAFWRTMVDNESIESVAQSLGKQVGSIYAARSRIMRRLREEVERISE